MSSRGGCWCLAFPRASSRTSIPPPLPQVHTWVITDLRNATSSFVETFALFDWSNFLRQSPVPPTFAVLSRLVCRFLGVFYCRHPSNNSRPFRGVAFPQRWNCSAIFHLGGFVLVQQSRLWALVFHQACQHVPSCYRKPSTEDAKAQIIWLVNSNGQSLSYSQNSMLILLAFWSTMFGQESQTRTFGILGRVKTIIWPIKLRQ